MQPESLPVDEPAHLARRLAQQLERSEAERADDRKLLDAMIRTAGVGVSLIDAERRFVRVNDILSDLFGVSVDALPGRPAIEILADELRAAGGDALERVFTTGEPATGFWRTRTLAGKYRNVHAHLERLPLQDGVQVLCVVEDVTPERTQQVLHSLTATVLEMVISGRPAGAILRRIGAAVRHFRPDAPVALLQKTETKLRRKYGAALPRGLDSWFHVLPLGPEGGPCAAAISQAEPVFCPDLATETRWPEATRTLRDHGCEAIWTLPFLGEMGEARGVLAVLLSRAEAPDTAEIEFLADVATLAGLALSREHSLRELRERVISDPLTGIGNRTLLEDRMDQQLLISQREGTTAAVLLLDLDNFKDVNDTRGHDAGDELLVITAERLAATVRASDTVARLGGDEFVVLLPNSSRAGACSVAQALLSALANSVAIGSEPVIVSPSIGVTLMTGDDADIDVVLKRADAAMYAAKAGGRNTYRFSGKS